MCEYSSEMNTVDASLKLQFTTKTWKNEEIGRSESGNQNEATILVCSRSFLPTTTHRVKGVINPAVGWTKQVPFGLPTARRKLSRRRAEGPNNSRVAEAKNATGSEFTQTNTRIRSEKKKTMRPGREISEQPTERKRALFSQQTEHSFAQNKWVGAFEGPVQYEGRLLGLLLVQFVPNSGDATKGRKTQLWGCSWSRSSTNRLSNGHSCVDSASFPHTLLVIASFRR